MALAEFAFERQSNPVDMVEFVAAINDWSFERNCEDELGLCVDGEWTQYQVSFCWMEDVEALHTSCSFDFNVPEHRRDEVLKLLSLINGQVLMGHFDIWADEGTVIFRQSLLLSGGAEATNRQVEMLLSGATDTCEIYYQAFHFVVWSGLPAQQAINLVLFDTKGNA